jgi:hypothetical protein
LDQERIRRAVAVERLGDPRWRVRSARGWREGWPVVEAGLLRRAAGLALREIAICQGTSRTTAHARVQIHDELVLTNADYLTVAIRLLARYGG